VVTLAPATIMLFGDAAWWLPKWLDKILPHISVEGETMPAGGDAGEEPEAPEPPPEPAGPPEPAPA